MSKKKIGFTAGNEDTEEKRDFIDQMLEDRKQAIKQFIEANYRSTGNVDEKEFKSSMELEYEMQEMTEASINTINSVMNELGFQVQFLEGKPYWVVYLKVL